MGERSDTLRANGGDLGVGVGLITGISTHLFDGLDFLGFAKFQYVMCIAMCVI